MAKQVKVIEREPGTKTVAKKTSVITWTKRIFAIFSVLWLALVIAGPLYVKNHYGDPIKKSIVVSMFFDLQRNIQEQYEQLLTGIKKSINLEKPIAAAVAQVKVAQVATAKVGAATDKAAATTEKAKGIVGLAGKFGVKTDAADSALAKATTSIAKLDDTTVMVNNKLDAVQNTLVRTAQTEVDKMIDDAIKSQLDKASGGLGTTLLTNYGIKHVYPWRPSSWPVGVKIYNDLAKSNLGVLQIITGTVDQYFGYVAWGLVVFVWLLGVIVWFMAFKKVKAILSPFIVCPNCGYAFADKRTAMGLLKVFQPWTWL